MTTGSVSRLEQGRSITAQRTLKYEVTFAPGLITKMARPGTPWLASNPGPNPRVVVVDRNVLAVYESEIRGLFDHDRRTTILVSSNGRMVGPSATGSTGSHMRLSMTSVCKYWPIFSRESLDE